MAYLSQAQLEAVEFKNLGKHVQISDKAAINNPQQIQLGDHAPVDDLCVLTGKTTSGRNVFMGVFSTIVGRSKSPADSSPSASR